MSMLSIVYWGWHNSQWSRLCNPVHLGCRYCSAIFFARIFCTYWFRCRIQDCTLCMFSCFHRWRILIVRFDNLDIYWKRQCSNPNRNTCTLLIHHHNLHIVLLLHYTLSIFSVRLCEKSFRILYRLMSLNIPNIYLSILNTLYNRLC